MNQLLTLRRNLSGDSQVKLAMCTQANLFAHQNPNCTLDDVASQMRQVLTSTGVIMGQHSSNRMTFDRHVAALAQQEVTNNNPRDRRRFRGGRGGGRGGASGRGRGGPPTGTPRYLRRPYTYKGSTTCNGIDISNLDQKFPPHVFRRFPKALRMDKIKFNAWKKEQEGDNATVRAINNLRTTMERHMSIRTRRSTASS